MVLRSRDRKGAVCLQLPKPLPYGHGSVSFMLATVLPAVAVLCGGCGYSQGQLLYFMGFGQGPKVEAEFELTRDGPVLILADDFEERVLSPRTLSELSKQLGEELQANKAVGKLVPADKLNRLRRQREDFDEISIRQVGELLEAHQVIYLLVRDFLADAQPEEISGAARMAVTVKVINVLEKDDPLKVRLWPTEREGRIVTTELDAAAVIRAKNPEAISTLLTEQVAVEVGRFFYDHRLEE